MRKTVGVILGVAVAAGLMCSAVADPVTITWTSNDASFYGSDGTTLLSGDKSSTGYLTSGFIELINGGSDGIGGAIADVVIQAAWVGAGYDLPFGSEDGTLAIQTDSNANGWPDKPTADLAVGDLLYIKVYDTASSNWGAGTAPTTGNFGLSGTTAVGQGNLDLGTITVNGGTVSTITPVPEPATWALFALGLATVVGCRRMRK